MQEFQIGDVVELRSGSQLMTITSIDADQNTAALVFWSDNEIRGFDDVDLAVLVKVK